MSDEPSKKPNKPKKPTIKKLAVKKKVPLEIQALQDFLDSPNGLIGNQGISLAMHIATRLGENASQLKRFMMPESVWLAIVELSALNLAAQHFPSPEKLVVELCENPSLMGCPVTLVKSNEVFVIGFTK
jgi:hypothetical protein